jgi:hypothetical protein
LAIQHAGQFADPEEAQAFLDTLAREDISQAISQA